ncbi:hypothetical protein CJU90_2866 [Yarrowia sp. C11]|nr:hypothetical protein CKK34_4313 [Yarrowia sp. E02]KAG5369414.1 hypothetical protein CJU90_2866 [Yarrowia sp. C11]
MRYKRVLALVTTLALAGALVSLLLLRNDSSWFGQDPKTPRLKAYLLTTTCERESGHLTEWMREGTYMLDSDLDVSPQCKSRPKWDYKRIDPPAGFKNPGSAPAKKFRPPETDEEREIRKGNPEYKFRTPEMYDWMVWVENKYRNKYAQTLRECSKGEHELCMLMEDDIVFINKRDIMLYRLAMHTLPEYSGPEVSWDCAKQGSGWEEVPIDGNKSQCRIFHRDYAGCLADYFETSELPADLALAEGMAHCKMKQKWFMLVQHTGRQSGMGHIDG